jgi:hypothetical protein
MSARWRRCVRAGVRLLMPCLVLAACGPEVVAMPSGDEASLYAEAVCDGIVDCGCVDRLGATDACIEEYEARFDELLAVAPAIDLECFDSVVSSAVLRDCRTVSGSDDSPLCVVMRGSKQRGETCRLRPSRLPLFQTNECGEGLACINGSCESQDDGDPAADIGESCDHWTAGSCETGYCGYDDRCHPRASLGQACDHPLACEDTLGGENYCRGIGSQAEGVCSVRSSAGEGCDPFDAYPCKGYCEPGLSVCVEGGPWVCESLNHFVAWP